MDWPILLFLRIKSSITWPFVSGFFQIMISRFIHIDIWKSMIFGKREVTYGGAQGLLPALLSEEPYPMHHLASPMSYFTSNRWSERYYLIDNCTLVRHVLFIHPSFHRYLDNFHLLILLNNTAMTCVLKDLLSISLDISQDIVSKDQVVIVHLTFWENSQGKKRFHIFNVLSKTGYFLSFG